MFALWYDLKDLQHAISEYFIFYKHNNIDQRLTKRQLMLAVMQLVDWEPANHSWTSSQISQWINLQLAKLW